MTLIPFNHAVLCLDPDCRTISDVRNDHCPACGNLGLLSLARVLQPCPELGAINFICCTLEES